MVRFAVTVLSATLASTGLAIVATPFYSTIAVAQTITPVTDVEVLIRMIGKTDPATATKIRKKFDEIDKSDRSPDDKINAKRAVVEREVQELEKLRDSAPVGADGRRILNESVWIARTLAAVILRQYRESLGGATVEPVRERDFRNAWVEGDLPIYSSKFLNEEFYQTRYELEDQRRREAQLDVPDLPPAENAPPGSGYDTGKPKATGFSATVGGGIAERKPTSQTYLAREFGGNLDLGVVAQSRDTTVSEGSFNLYWDAGDSPAFAKTGVVVAELHIRNLKGSSSQNIGDYDTAGGGLGIPGVEDAGVFLNNPSEDDVTDVTGLFGAYDFESWETGIRFEGFGVQISELLAYKALFGVSYIGSTEDQSFGGRVDGFLTDFRYDSHLSRDTVKVEVGARFDYELSGTLGFFVEPTASLNFIGITGWDGLEISGHVNDSQLVDLDGRETLPGVKLAVGFDWEPDETPFSIYVGAHIAHEPDSVSVFRSGLKGEQSKANAEYSTSYGLSASLNMRF